MIFLETNLPFQSSSYVVKMVKSSFISWTEGYFCRSNLPTRCFESDGEGQDMPMIFPSFPESRTLNNDLRDIIK